MIIKNAATILSVHNLVASIDGTQILKGFDITVKAGEIHAIMGPSGSGKSTFSKVLAGHPSYTVDGGTLEFKGQSLMDLEPDERAKLGVFLGFQYPVEVPGVTNGSFLRLAYNTVQGARGKDELDPLEFDDFIQSKLSLLGMDASFLERSLNDGFSGGEEKRNEIGEKAVLRQEKHEINEKKKGKEKRMIDTFVTGGGEKRIELNIGLYEEWNKRGWNGG